MEKYKPCIILGMHRSGTSCLTGALEKCGLFLGEIQRKSKHNKKGNFEQPDIYRVHDQILALNRATWLNPPHHQIKLHPYHSNRIKDIISNLQERKRWGVKDPRTLLLLDEWKCLLSYHYQFVGSFRHPVSVAKSLFKRDGIAIEEGINIWKFYNSILVEEHKKTPFPRIEYDRTNKKDYIKKILEIAHLLDLKPNLFRLKFFVSTNLEHQKNKGSIPKSCLNIYNYLKREAQS